MKQFLIGILMMFIFVAPVLAEESPVVNNKFGIHLAVPQIDDIERSAQLVNSTGGDWGYVTLVMEEKDRDHGKWQHVFDRMRQLHLIPIIRLATSPQLDVWRKPDPTDAPEWVRFLDSLNWVVKDRYIVLFNEPNHHSEWGGEVDANSFAEVTMAFAQELKKSNEDYFIMLGGLDASAPSEPPIYEDEEVFLRTVFSRERVDRWNQLLSGWSSHSYPNPAFAGPPSGRGRGTVRTYLWEKSLLSQLGLRNLPVFITETGWDANVLSDNKVATNMQYVFENVWGPDEDVVAVTPFLLNYQSEPFLGFSWMAVGTNAVKPVFDRVRGITKPAGLPRIVNKASIQGSLPYELVVGSIYRFPMELRNIGQAIWNQEDKYIVRIEGVDGTYYYGSEIGKLEPLHDTSMFVYAQTISEEPGKREAEIWLYKDTEKIQMLRRWSFEVLPRPSLRFEAQVFPAFFADSQDYELQIFDENEQLVFKKKNVEVKDAQGTIAQVPNVLFNHIYRVVLLRPSYLPRQGHVLFRKGENSIIFPLTVPIDFNGDGTFDSHDIPALFR